MSENKQSFINRCLSRLFGGLPMNWPAVILFAVAAAALTAVFLILPVFKDTSFERMGVMLEAWIFFAVLIMANSRSPLDSALKTFVFFLVSQPLIYLFQVPFSPLGWQLFRFYRYWFIWTLFTFPMAFVGWYITRRNWLSVLIFAPVLAFLGYTAYDCGRECLQRFPHLLIAALFCLGQILLYCAAFFPDRRQRLVGLLIPVAAAVVFFLTTPQLSLSATEILPGKPSFSEDAAVSVEDASLANVQFHSSEEGVLYLNASKYGSTTLVIRDNGEEFRYTLEIYRDGGAPKIRITPQD